MAVMGMRLAQRVNGVSLLHGAVSREMFTGLWPGFDTAEVPIGSVTNGVHAPTWVAPEILEPGPGGPSRRRLIWATTRRPGRGWPTDPARIWEIRRLLRGRLVAAGAAAAAGLLAAARRLRRRADLDRQRAGREHPDHRLRPPGAVLQAADPDAARPERLTELLLDPDRPVQILIAGKAHPADEGGKLLIQQMVKFADDPRVRHRIVFLPDYDMALARSLVQGCDVWLNNPLRPLEACGTSGMKSALNGGLNLSVLDGWWDEWFDGANGWAIPSADWRQPTRTGATSSRPAALYDLLEPVGGAAVLRRRRGRAAAPLAGDGRAHAAHARAEGAGHPHGPAVRDRPVRAGRAGLGGAGRQRDAGRSSGAGPADDDAAGSGSGEQPAPAARRPDSAADSYAAPAAGGWKRRVTAAWPGVRVDHVEADDGALTPGGRLTIRASIALGELTPDDVAVEVVYGQAGDDRRDHRPGAHGADPRRRVGSRRRHPLHRDSRARPAGPVRLHRPGAAAATRCSAARPSSAWSRSRRSPPGW